MHQKLIFFSATGGEENLAYPVCCHNRNWAQQTTAAIEATILLNQQLHC
jgi:hypothetical protein